MTDRARQRPVWHRVALLVGAAYLLFGLWGLGSSFVAERCLDLDRSPADRVRACAIAATTTPARFSAEDRGEYARIITERLVVLAETGQTDRARAASAALRPDQDRPVILDRIGGLPPASPALPLLRDLVE